MSFSLDFNHGQSGNNAVRIGDISDDVNEFVDAAFARKRDNEPARKYIGASGIGNDCLRAVQLGYMGIPTDAEAYTGKTLRIFETGHVFEGAVADWLNMAGFELEVLDPESNKQFGWSVLDDDGKGHIDGIIRRNPLGMAFPRLWECKALNARSWQDVKKHGLAVSKPYYMKQIALNQAYLELHEHPAIFTALNKNTSELYHEAVPFDQALAQRTSDDIVKIVDATESQILLPRAFNEPEHFKCRMCPHAKTCWEKLK